MMSVSEPIEFPLNFARYLEMGKAALAENKLELARDNFFDAYNLEESFEANYLLVQVLVALGEFPSAKKIANEMKASYLASEEQIALFLQVLLGNQEFILARKVIQSVVEKTKIKETYLETVSQRETVFMTYQQKELLKKQGDINQQLAGDFIKQAQGLRQLETLPLSLYLGQSQQLITNKAFPLVLRNSLLESLAELGESIELVIFDIMSKEHVVNTSEIGTVQQQKSYQGSLAAVQLAFEQSESDLFRELLEELRLHFTCLYPLADTFVSDGAKWSDLVIANYLGQEHQLSGEELLTYQKLQNLIKREQMEMLVYF